MADPRSKRGTSPGSRPVYTCPICELRTFKVEELEAHMESHGQATSFSCSSCNLSFHLLSSLQKHLHEHAQRKAERKDDSPAGKQATANTSTGESEEGSLACSTDTPRKEHSQRLPSTANNDKESTGKLSYSATSNNAAMLGSSNCRIPSSSPSHLCNQQKEGVLTESIGTTNNDESTDGPFSTAERPSSATDMLESTEQSSPKNTQEAESSTHSSTSDTSKTIPGTGDNLDPSSPSPTDSEPVEPLYFRITFDEINLVWIPATESQEKEKEMFAVGAKKMPFKCISGLKRYSCSICGLKFAKYTSLQKHIVSHRKPGTLLCEICNKTFRRKDRLKVHYVSHIEKGDTRIKCSECGKTLRNKVTLQLHMKRVHGNREKSYLCDICGYRSQEIFYHNQHIKLHADVKPYTCKICSKSFKRSDYLLRHMPSHSRKKPYNCAKCNKGFGRKQYLDMHLTKKICERPGYKEKQAQKKTNKEQEHTAESVSENTGGDAKEELEMAKCTEENRRKSKRLRKKNVIPKNADTKRKRLRKRNTVDADSENCSDSSEDK